MSLITQLRAQRESLRVLNEKALTLQTALKDQADYVSLCLAIRQAQLVANSDISAMRLLTLRRTVVELYRTFYQLERDHKESCSNESYCSVVRPYVSHLA